jgi:hypothetical protein
MPVAQCKPDRFEPLGCQVVYFLFSLVLPGSLTPSRPTDREYTHRIFLHQVVLWAVALGLVAAALGTEVRSTYRCIYEELLILNLIRHLVA